MEMEDIKEAVIMCKISSKRADVINKMAAFALIGLVVFVTIYYPQVYAFAADEAAAGADLVKILLAGYMTYWLHLLVRLVQ